MSLRYFTSAILLELDTRKCTGCGRCIEVCPHDVFRLVRDDMQVGTSPPCAGRSSNVAHPRFRVAIRDRDRCMECGACALNCPVGAIKAGAGVGCATAIINGMLRGTPPTCGCSCDGSKAPNGCGRSEEQAPTHAADSRCS